MNCVNYQELCIAKDNENKVLSNVKMHIPNTYSQLKVHIKIDSHKQPDNTVTCLDSEKSELLLIIMVQQHLI